MTIFFLKFLPVLFCNISPCLTTKDQAGVPPSNKPAQTYNNYHKLLYFLGFPGFFCNIFLIWTKSNLAGNRFQQKTFSPRPFMKHFPDFGNKGSRWRPIKPFSCVDCTKRPKILYFTCFLSLFCNISPILTTKDLAGDHLRHIPAWTS